MKKVGIIKTHPDLLADSPAKYVQAGKEDYEFRAGLLQERIKGAGLDCAIIYGDREHFSSISYFTGFDCRFEEALFIRHANGECHILVGNEGTTPAQAIELPVKIHLYQNFSLQGQPRGNKTSLKDLLASCGLTKDSKVGLVGVKYMEDGMEGDPDITHDVPAYILSAVTAASGSVVNFTQAINGLDGIRSVLYSAKEIAIAEYAASEATRALLNVIKGLKPGLSEIEVSRSSNMSFEAINVHPSCNFGPEHVFIGLRSPDNRALELGEVCGLCFSMRHCLVSRVGVAAYDEASYAPELKGTIEKFYKPYWAAIATWYESIRVGAVSGEVYESVMDIVGGEYFGVMLSPGHMTGSEEWVNAPINKGSDFKLKSGMHLQADLITSGVDPVRVGICEDSVVIADSELRKALEKEYPDVYARITERRRLLREVLNVNVHDDLLPMSNFNLVYFPFMLNMDAVFAFV